MNYGDLQAQVSGLLNRRDATTTQIKTWIQLGLQRIQRELRCPAMEKTVTLTIANTNDPITIPSDLLELIDLIAPDGHRLIKEDVTRVTIEGKTPGIGRWFYRMGGRWLIAPNTTAGDIYTICYYAEIGELTNPTDENIITDIGPDLITYAALNFAGDFFVDKRTTQWESRYQQIVQNIQGMSDADELTGGATVSPAYEWPADDF